MRNVVQLCLAANDILLIRKRTTLFSFLRSLWREKWQIAELPKLKIFINKKSWRANGKTIDLFTDTAAILN